MHKIAWPLFEWEMCVLHTSFPRTHFFIAPLTTFEIFSCNILIKKASWHCHSKSLSTHCPLITSHDKMKPSIVHEGTHNSLVAVRAQYIRDLTLALCVLVPSPTISLACCSLHLAECHLKPEPRHHVGILLVGDRIGG